MIADNRNIFLDLFLGLCGVEKVEITSTGGDKVFGITNYMDYGEK